jgi:hypothetical protein
LRKEAEPFALLDGPEGTRVEVFDETRPYGYKNLFTVALRVVATFPASGERFERTLERTGVFEEEVAAARAELLDNFRVNGLPYLFRKDFAHKLALARGREKPKKSGYGGLP